MGDYYIARRDRLLRQFDRVFRHVRGILSDRDGEGFADATVAESRAEFDRLLGELPYLGGGSNPFTRIIVVNGWLIALYRAMTRRGKPERDVVAVGCELADRPFRSVPGRLLRLSGSVGATVLPLLLRRLAARSQERRHPADWVFRVLDKCDEFDLGLEFEQCAVMELYDAQGVPELKPYCNFFDLTYSRHMNLGLDASHTLGLGCDTCRLLYKRGRPTLIPSTLDGLMPPL